ARLDLRSNPARRHAELGEHLPGELLRLLGQGEDQVLGPDVVMAELARMGVGGAQCLRRGAGQPERDLTGRRGGQRAEALLRGLLARSERAADLGPARPTLARSVDELVE